MAYLSDKPTLQDHQLKQQILVFEAKIGSHATPASKTHETDLPGVAYLRTEGKTATADAVEDVASQVDTTAADATGIFAVLLDIPVSKVYGAEVVATSSGTATVAAEKTTGGLILLNCDTSLSLAATDLDISLEVKYKE